MQNSSSGLFAFIRATIIKHCDWIDMDAHITGRIVNILYYCTRSANSLKNIYTLFQLENVKNTKTSSEKYISIYT